MNTLRLYYFAMYIGPGAVLPLLALALAARGFAPSEYAWIMALSPLARLFAPPLWGALADRFVGTTRLLRMNTLVVAAAMTVLALSDQLVTTALAYGVWALASSSLTPLADAAAYRALGSASSRFGYVRVFGSIGFAASAITIGLTGTDEGMRAPFLISAGGYLASSLIARVLPDTAPPTRAPLREALRSVVGRPDAWLLWIGSVLYYLAHGTFDAYFGPYARTLPDVSNSLISSAWALGVVSEVVLLFFVPRLLQTRSARWVLVACAAIATARWLLIASAETATDLWLQQPLHGLTFGVWYLGFLHDNQADTPRELRATVQGVGAACMGLGMILATLLGGYLLERFGGRVLFLLAASTSFLALVAYALRMRLLSRAAQTSPATPPRGIALANVEREP